MVARSIVDKSMLVYVVYTITRPGLYVPSVGPEDRILIILPEWLRLIYRGPKKIEIRSVRYASYVGKRIFLCASESSEVSGCVTLQRIEGPLSSERWASLRGLHCVPGDRAYGDITYAWWMDEVEYFSTPIPIVRKHGSVITQVGPGRS